MCTKDDEKNKTSPLFDLAFFIVALVPRVSSPVTRVCCSPLFAPKRAKDKAPDDDDDEAEEEGADLAQLRAIIQLKKNSDLARTDDIVLFLECQRQTFSFRLISGYSAP